MSSLKIASEILARFGATEPKDQLLFLQHINYDLDVDPAEITEAAAAYAGDASPENYRTLALVSEPKRFELLRRLNQPSGATAEIVRMRAVLLEQIRENPELARTDTDFALMLRAWFNRGFLVLPQITWDSPASILEKLINH